MIAGAQKQGRAATILSKRTNGFTIVELLIVVVVIAILAAITIVAFAGVQNRAKDSAAQSAASQAAKRIEATMAGSAQGVYPATLEDTGLVASGSTAYQYTRSADTKGYCVTTLTGGVLPYSIGTGRTITPNPCDGHNGGPAYCPTDTYVPINGFYCEGTDSAVATRNENVVKLSSAATEVPADAPGSYVGRQTGRDNLIGSTFVAAPGEVYCIEGWAATSTSTVGHTIGLRVSAGTTQWLSVSYAPAAGAQWKKMQGCLTMPAGTTNANLWSQNNGTNGTTASPAWYQTAIRFWKQS